MDSVQFLNPRRVQASTADMAQLQDRINQATGASVTDLQVVKKCVVNQSVHVQFWGEGF